jgi:outer membrane immunogenic protein
MTRFLAGLIFVLLPLSTASAADLPVKVPAVAAQIGSWTGFYVGASAGFRADEADPHFTSSTFAQVGGTTFNQLDCGSTPCPLGEPLRGPSLRIAPYAGFNWQVSPQWVLGVEADYGFGGRTSTFSGSFIPFISGNNFDTFSVKTRWDASARARVGYLAAPNVLVYATGGAAWTRVDTTSNCGAPQPGPGGGAIGNCTNTLALFGGNSETPATIGFSTSRTGWTLGGGVEAALWSNWILRAEYRYADFGTFSATDVRTCAAPCVLGPAGVNPAAVFTDTYDVHLRTHMANFGIAYKFGDPIVTEAAEPTRLYTKAPQMAAALSWTGFYVGLGAGMRANRSDATVTADKQVFGGVSTDRLANCPTCTTSEPFNDSSARIAPYAG